MKKNKKIYIPIIILAVVVISIIFFKPSGESVTGEFDDFVNCLAEKDAKFYGAYWCGHCNTQKELFHDSEDLIKEKVYIECADDAINNEREKCIEAGITAYPTWIINGEKSTGTKSISQLSELSGCEV